MLKFGVKNKFEIWVDYYYLKYKDNDEFIQNFEKYKSWASVYFWVNNKNLFQFKDYGPEATYGFDLTVLINFFCTNLFYFTTDDAFPVETSSKNGFDMMEEVQLIPGDDDDILKWAKMDWDIVNMSVRNKIDIWNHRHGFISNREGSFLPDTYFRKVNKKIEISWNNTHPHQSADGEFYFEHKQGIEFIEVKLFRDTIVNFCLDFIEKFQNEYPNLVTEYKLNLQKAMNIDLE